MNLRQRGDAPSALRPRHTLLVPPILPASGSFSVIIRHTTPSHTTRHQSTPVLTRVWFWRGAVWLRSLAGCAIHRCAAPQTWPQCARIMFMQSPMLPVVPVVPAAAAWHRYLVLRLLPCPLTLPMFRLQSTNTARHLKGTRRPTGLRFALAHTRFCIVPTRLISPHCVAFIIILLPL